VGGLSCFARVPEIGVVELFSNKPADANESQMVEKCAALVRRLVDPVGVLGA
jgi:hypothetical protein